ncbi:MAG: 50S ribosomal protein L35 [Candidatus Omnitrophota bacterium]|jgi:large subunit ribosomal protein L35|nr:50S ribosomal protein L35 [Candidatus Omnitrophota bacterium]|tara:strand:- start:219 stop:416 length:198 start_codon:yes stop_codon:yes gene_type:complete
MPKLKTKKSVKKRFKLTKKKKLKRYKPGRRHLLTSKSSGRKRKMRKTTVVEGLLAKITKKLLPYG